MNDQKPVCEQTNTHSSDQYVSVGNSKELGSVQNTVLHSSIVSRIGIGGVETEHTSGLTIPVETDWTGSEVGRIVVSVEDQDGQEARGASEIDRDSEIV